MKGFQRGLPSVWTSYAYKTSPKIPTKAAIISLFPNETALAPPVKGAGLVGPAPAPVPTGATFVELLGMTYGGVEVDAVVAVVSVTAMEDEVVVVAGDSEVGDGVSDDDVAEALYATVVPDVKPSGSVTPCCEAQVCGSTPYSRSYH